MPWTAIAAMQDMRQAGAEEDRTRSGNHLQGNWLVLHRLQGEAVVWWMFAIIGVALWLIIYLGLREFERLHKRINELMRKR